MTYDYNSKIYLAEAVLNVKDLARQTAFYTQVIGLEILSQTATEIILGAGNKPLVHLIETNREEAVKSSYGLYHMAIMLPSREDLADVFKHIAELDYPFVGAADHGYSEALYLEDLEAMVLSSTEIKLLLNGIFVRMVASLVSQKHYQLKKFTRWDARLSLL